jgi:hypothetical protein
MKPLNFCDALMRFIDIGREITTLMPTTGACLPPYWVRCFEAFSQTLNKKIVEDYNVNRIPECDRFPKLRNEFLALYESFQDEFSSDLLIVVDGKKQLNDSWLRIIEENSDDTTNDEEKEQIDRSEFFSGFSKNRNISIVIKKKEPGTKKVDIELPISEMLETAILLRKSGFKKPNHPMAVICALYECVSFAVPQHHSKVDEIIEDLFPLTIKDESEIQSKVKSAKEMMKPLMRTNGALMETIMKRVSDGIDEMPDENIDEITRIAQEQLSNLDSKEGGLKSILGNFLPGSDDDTLAENGISIDAIRNLVDRQQSGAISNEELMASIPTSLTASFSDMVK